MSGLPSPRRGAGGERRGEGAWAHFCDRACIKVINDNIIVSHLQTSCCRCVSSCVCCRFSSSFRCCSPNKLSKQKVKLKKATLVYAILVPRVYDSSGLRQESRALGATELNRMGRIRLFPLLFQNGCSQSSRFLPQARRIVGSGDEEWVYAGRIRKRSFISTVRPTVHTTRHQNGTFRKRSSNLRNLKTLTASR